ncbi:hypothetical protein SEEN202_23419 [Salmonella enterica subsp. enterica serovar Newport str. CVM 35202]|nr:hypothetical protein SEEN202_23419 [Salmonella enterica subsp. enterica serovar Newport str. CVM 35202]
MQQEENVLGINGVPAGIENVFKAMFYTVYFNGEFFDTIMDTITR